MSYSNLLSPDPRLSQLESEVYQPEVSHQLDRLFTFDIVAE